MDSDTAGARHFAASLYMLADIAESNADAAHDQRVSDAYTDIATAIRDKANNLRVVCDDCDGVWARLPDVMELPLEVVG